MTANEMREIEAMVRRVFREEIYALSDVLFAAAELPAKETRNQSEDLTGRAVSWIKRQNRERFTKRELHRAIAKNKKVEVVEHVLVCLVEQGLVIEESPPPRVARQMDGRITVAGGRPSPAFVVVREASR